MANFALSCTIASEKANCVINIDIVNPIPANIPTPISPFQLRPIGRRTNFILTLIHVNNKIPIGFPKDNPKIIPKLLADNNDGIDSPEKTNVVLLKANSGKITKETG